MCAVHMERAEDGLASAVKRHRSSESDQSMKPHLSYGVSWVDRVFTMLSANAGEHLHDADGL